MSASVKAGFVIGFVIAAILGGLWSWREGMWKPREERQAQTQTSPQSGSVPQSQDSESSSGGSSSSSAPSGPNPVAPSVTPTPRANQPGVTPTPGATQPGVRPPSNSSPNGADASPSGSTPSGQANAGATAKPEADERKGAFDIVRVEPSGDAVVAGRCAAPCTAELTSNGRVIDTAKADASGSFAMTPSTLSPGDHQLGLTVTTPDGKKQTSEQTVTVSVPQAPSKEVVVVLNEPNAPSQVLQRPGQEPAAAAPAKPNGQMAARSGAAASPADKVAALSLGAIDADQGRFFLQGTAPVGSKLRIYLNNALISEATPGLDGRWSLRVERGLTAGAYTARVDHVDAGGKVVKRAESSFDYEGEAAAAPAPKAAETPAGSASAAQPAAGREASAASDKRSAGIGNSDAGAPNGDAAQSPAPAAGADPANPVVAAIDTARVKRGDSLWRISRIVYGQGRRYTIIFSANDSQIRNPDLIYPGQVLVVPSQGAEASVGTR